MSDKKKRKALSFPFVLRLPSKKLVTVEFNYIPKAGSRFKLGEDEYKVKGFDGPIIVLVKIKILTEEEQQERAAKRFKEAKEFFWGDAPVAGESEIEAIPESEEQPEAAEEEAPLDEENQPSE